MTDGDRGQTVVTHVGSCRCPGTPHASGERVRFADQIPLALGAAGTAALQSASDPNEFIGLLAPIYLRFGIIEWSCLGTNDSGEVVGLPITKANVEERFPWVDGGAILAEAADVLYGKDLLDPLVKRRSNSSNDGEMETSISPTSPTGAVRQKPSKPSSRTALEAGKPFVAPAP